MATFSSRPRGGKLAPVKRVTTKVRAKTKAKTKLKAPAKTAPAAPALDPMDAQVLAATALQYGGADQALAGQRGIHQQQTAAIPGYFQEYQAGLARATQAQQAANAMALGAQQNAINTSSALDAQQRAALTGQMQSDAAARGATVDPAIAATAQQAAAARRSTADASLGLTAQLGGAEVGYRAGRQAVGAGQRLTALTDEARRGRAIEGQQLALNREKGAFAVATKQKMQEAAHTRELENKAFGLNVAKAEADVAADRARIQESRRARTTTNRNVDQSRAQQRAIAERRLAESERANRRREELAAARLRTTAKTKPDKQAAKDAAKVRNNVNTAAADARTLRNAPIQIKDPKTNKPTGKTRKLTESEIRANLRKRYKDADVANAAMDIAILGHIGPVNARRLRKRGITVPKAWLPKRKTLAEIAQGRPGISSRPPAGSGLG